MEVQQFICGGGKDQLQKSLLNVLFYKISLTARVILYSELAIYPANFSISLLVAHVGYYSSSYFTSPLLQH